MHELLTVPDLAKLTSRSTRAVYADIARGKWPVVRLGRRVFFRPATVEAFIAAHEVPALPERVDPTGKGR